MKSITIQVFGGLAGQLSGLAYAIFIHDYFGARVKLVFYSGGTSERPLVVKPLLETPTIASRAITYGTLSSKDQRISLSKNFSVPTLEFLMSGLWPVSQRSLQISLEDLYELRGQKHRIVGYLSDFRIVENVVGDIHAAIDQAELPNFLKSRPGDQSVAVHWRLGDYVGNDFHGVISATALLSGLDEVCPDWRSRTVKIFTDSPTLAKKGLAKSSSSFQFPSGSIWEHLEEMTRSSYFLGSHSGISQWAAIGMLRHPVGRQILLPRSWFSPNSGGIEALASPKLHALMKWDITFSSEI